MDGRRRRWQSLRSKTTWLTFDLGGFFELSYKSGDKETERQREREII